MSTLTNTTQQFAFYIEKAGQISRGNTPPGTTSVANPSTGHYRVQFQPIASIVPIVEITADTTNLGKGYVVSPSVQNVDTNSFDIYIQDLNANNKDCGLNVMMAFAG